MAKITGAFLDFSNRTNQFSETLGKGAEFWKQELSDMKNSGFDTVIISRAMILGRTHYQSMHYEDFDGRWHLDHVARAAEELGLNLYIGLNLNLQFWNRSRDLATMLKRDLNISRVLFDELHRRYGGMASLKGYYIPNEPDCETFSSSERREEIRKYLNGIYVHIKEHCSLNILNSPFYSKTTPPEKLAEWWDELIDRPMFDIVAMQDGVGCARDCIVPEDASRYYPLLADVLKNKGVVFWNNVETFAQDPRGAVEFHPAPIRRVDRQYRAGFNCVDKSITWEYSHFIGRLLNGDERYEQFKAWNLGFTEA